MSLDCLWFAQWHVMQYLLPHDQVSMMPKSRARASALKLLVFEIGNEAKTDSLVPSVAVSLSEAKAMMVAVMVPLLRAATCQIFMSRRGHHAHP